MLRDWTDSKKMDQLKAEEEVLFTRLLMKADDYGNFYANPVILKSLLFPRKDGLRSADIGRWLRSLEAAALIRLYTHDGEAFLTIENFGQRLRQHRRVFPEPPEYVSNLSATCQQLADNPPPEEKRREHEDEGEVKAREGAKSTHPPNVEAEAGKGSKKALLHANVGARARGAHLFTDSEYYDQAQFEEAFANTEYAHCDLKYYYNRMKNWAASRSEKKVDWLATARNFMLGDSADGKLRLKKQHGTGPNGTRSAELSAAPGGQGRERRV